MPGARFPHQVPPQPSSVVPNGIAIETTPQHSEGTRRFRLFLATAGGVGLLPQAPGTFGAALAIPIFVLLSPWPPTLTALTWGALLALGVWAAGAAEEAWGQHDDGRVVIDEVVGQLLAYAPLLAAGVPSGFSALPWIWPSLVTGFVAFRVFDIAKPGPVGWADRELGGGWGVMVDDVVAGALAALVLAALMLALDGPGLRIAAALSGAGQPS